MQRIFAEILDVAAIALEVVGAAIIIGVAAVVVVVLGNNLVRYRTLPWRISRHLLGRGLVMGLEFMIAADILLTIAAPNLEELAVLGAIVVLRTVLAFSIEFELREMAREPEEGPGR